MSPLRQCGHWNTNIELFSTHWQTDGYYNKPVWDETSVNGFDLLGLQSLLSSRLTTPLCCLDRRQVFNSPGDALFKAWENLLCWPVPDATVCSLTSDAANLSVV